MFQIKIFSEEVGLFLGERGELFSVEPPFRWVRSGVRGLEFYPPLKRLLFWQKDKIDILDFSEKPQLVWVLRRGESIEEVFWVYEGSHILFRDQGKVFLVALETHGKPHLHFLFEVKGDSPIVYSEESGKVYYLDKAKARLTSVEILPRGKVLRLPFPERKEEKKKSQLQEL